MKSLATLVLLFLSTLLFSQAIETSFNTVIAQSGLKLRSAPGLDSKVISIIPYRGQVAYLDERLYGRDTIGLLPDFPGRVLEKVYSSRTYENRSVIGHWVHVRFQEKEGYVFNPYLGPDANQVPQQDFFLISPGDNCGDQFYDLQNFYTFGIYRKGHKTWTEVIKVSYVVQTEGIGFLAPVLTTSKNKYLQHVIGHQKKMSRPKPVWSAFYPNSRNYSQSGYKTFKAGLPEVVVSDSLFSEGEVLKKAVFFDRNTKNKQPIDNANYGREYQIIGKGDLDGDGRTDILLEFRNAELLTRRLYLSSLAKKGEIYGLAAEENFGYCC